MSTDVLNSPDVVQIPDLLALRARSHPDAAPLSVDGTVHLTYGEWDARANAVAHGLLDRGLKRGDRVALYFGGLDWIEYAVAYLAVLKAGGTATHLNDVMGAQEVRRRLGHARAVGIIRSAALPAPAPFPGWTATTAEAETGDTSPVPVVIAPEDVADILYTSGTTGPAKPFLNPHGNASFGRGWGAHAEAIFDQSAPLLSPLPLGTAYSASTAGVFALTTTAPIIVSAPDDVEHMAELVARHRVASVMLRPKAAMEFVRTRVGDRHDLSSVSVLGVASGALPPRYARELLAMMPGARISTAYGGGSEAVPAHLRTVYDPDRPLNMGRAQTGTHLQITDDDGEPLPAGHLGEIWLKTAAPRRGYLDPAHDDRVFVRGWVRTGDIGRVDEDGELYFFDRGDDAVRSAGRLISSLEVENVLYEHPAVREAAAFAVPSPGAGQALEAAVVLDSGSDTSVPVRPVREAAAALRAFAAERLAPHQVPAAIHVLDELPRDGVSDKVLKVRLRERFAGR